MEFDYAIVKLGPDIRQNGGGLVCGVEIDTAFFNGNEAPAISVEGFAPSEGGVMSDEDEKRMDENVTGWKHGKGEWQTILCKQTCGPSRRQAWLLNTPTSRPYTYVRLNMYPDGGIARFRLYGNSAMQNFSTTDPNRALDLAAAVNGGRCVGCSNEHYAKTSNLLLPGRGTDVSDGWETRRSREPGHTDWVIVRLGAPSKLHTLVVDTAHFRGNFPQKCQVYGIDWTGKSGEPGDAEPGWADITGIQECKGHWEHEYAVPSSTGQISHVKLVIIPDGGVKRVRAFGIPSTHSARL